MQTPKACIIIIGNEILSGRTQDKNVSWIASSLSELGITLSEVRIIPDSDKVIIDAIKLCSSLFNYVFTTGGIGPTHDDITSKCVAVAFDVPIQVNTEARIILEKHYGKENLNSARLKMAEIPQGSKLIYNPISAAPGFIIENVYVMAGVPSIMQAMFDSIKGELRGGDKIISKALSIYATEGVIAEGLTTIQNQFPDVEIGSYPFIHNEKLGTSIVSRSRDQARLDSCYDKLKVFLLTIKPEIEESDLTSS